MEEKIVCQQSQKAKYTGRVDYIIQLPVPMDQATNAGIWLRVAANTRRPVSASTYPTRGLFILTEELQEAERRREEGDSSAPTVRAQIPFTACMAALSEPEILTDFWSSAAQAKTTATKYKERQPHTESDTETRFANYKYLSNLSEPPASPRSLTTSSSKLRSSPLALTGFQRNLVSAMEKKSSFLWFSWNPAWQKWACGSDSVECCFFRADVSIDVPDTLDLSALRATGQQPGEELLPEVAPPPLMTPDVEVKGILGSHGNEEDDSLYSPLLC